MRLSSNQQGFTIMEIVVATALFATTVTFMSVLFVYVLKINRHVEAVRQASQDTRNFAELIVREIRNGSIDYTGVIDPVNCPVATPQYSQLGNQTLALITRSGDQECFFLSDFNAQANTADLKVSRKSVNGTFVTEQINPPNSTIALTNFRFVVRPTVDPFSSPAPGVQPFVIILMDVRVKVGDATMDIPYQTTVSTDVYNIPHN